MWSYRVVGPSRLEISEIPPPLAGDLQVGDVLVHPVVGGICGSDMPKFAGAKDLRWTGGRLEGAPGAPLHEVVATVVASADSRFHAGETVVGWASRSNALADRVVTDGDRLWGYGVDLPPEHAIVVQSLACVLEAMSRLPVRGAHVAVVGLGPIGLLFAHAARRDGAAKVVGVDPVDRSGVAGAFGISEQVQAASGPWVQNMSSGERPDVVIEAVGHQTATLDHAIQAVTPGGTVLYFGIPDQPVYPLDMEQLMRRSVTLIGGVTRRHRAALAEADRYLSQHPDLARQLITHTFSRHEVQAAYDAAATLTSARRKVVITFE